MGVDFCDAGGSFIYKEIGNKCELKKHKRGGGHLLLYMYLFKMKDLLAETIFGKCYLCIKYVHAFFTFNHTFQFAQILHSIYIVPIRKIISNTNNNNSIKPAPSHANKRLRKCGVNALRNMHAAMYNFDDFIYNLFKLNCLNLG